MEIRIVPVAAAALAGARETGLDEWGDPVGRVTAEGGEPVRCCLRYATAGEELLLLRYEPPLPAASPYRETGAVYAHAVECGGPPDGFPEQWRDRAQVLRAYDDRGWIHPATRVHDGPGLAAALSEVLAAPGVVAVHSRNIAYGCYMFTAVRA